jgi:hypothetical protein
MAKEIFVAFGRAGRRCCSCWHISGHDGVRWADFHTIAEDFKARSPRVK